MTGPLFGVPSSESRDQGHPCSLSEQATLLTPRESLVVSGMCSTVTRSCVAGSTAALLALGCGDGLDPSPPQDGFDVSLEIHPDSGDGWVADRLYFSIVISGPDADTLEDLLPDWTIDESSVATLVSAGRTAIVVIRGEGRAVVTATVDTFVVSATVVGFEEGALLAARPWASLTQLRSPAVADDGSIYLLRSETGALLAFDAGLARSGEA